MKTLKKIITSPVFSIAAVVVAAGLLIFATVSGARAALNVESDEYYAHVELYKTGVSLLENGEIVAFRNYDADGKWNETAGDDHIGTLLGKMLGEDEELKLGKSYKEELSVSNTGEINEFVRVSIYKYWLDPEGNKTQALDPSVINLNLLTGNGWVEDTSARTDERTVLYYTNLLKVGETTSALSDTLIIDDYLATEVTQEKSVDEEGYTVITTTYLYDDYSFVIEAQVDAVQEHNAAAAVKSAWGKNVTISGSTLSLKK